MVAARLTLISKPGCHLCDDARAVVQTVLGEFGEVSLDEVSILDHPDLYEKYVEEIPVLLLNGAVHNIWRVDAQRLRSALEEATA
ncbi:MAG: glutaredoxin family protein [Microbacteriaceae bacterium]